MSTPPQPPLPQLPFDGENPWGTKFRVWSTALREWVHSKADRDHTHLIDGIPGLSAVLNNKANVDDMAAGIGIIENTAIELENLNNNVLPDMRHELEANEVLISDAKNTAEEARAKAENALEEAFAAQGGVDGALAAVTALGATLDPKITSAQSTANQASTDAVNALIASSGAMTNSYDEFALSSTPNTAPTSGWEANVQWVTGAYLWRRSVVTKGDGEVITGVPVLITGNTGASGEDAVLLRISSSRGTSFKNAAVSTVLSVTIFRGSEQIVNISALHNSFGTGAYLEWFWRRLDDSDFGVILSSDERLGRSGFDLTVSPDDVDAQTVFQCILHT